MKKSYIKGVANHDDPESCVGDREVAGEALTGARAGWGYRVESRETTMVRSADAVVLGGRQHGPVRERECGSGSSRSLNSCMHEVSLHGNREISRWLIGDGR